MRTFFKRFRHYILATAIFLVPILLGSVLHWIIVAFSLPPAVQVGGLLTCLLLVLIWATAQAIKSISGENQ